MKQYALNIGLNTSLNFIDQVETLTPKHVLQELKNAYLQVDFSKVVESDTELTLVALVTDLMPCGDSNIEPQIAELADTLMQDCIAWYDVDKQEGFLTGQYAEQWGEFDKRYFII